MGSKFIDIFGKENSFILCLGNYSIWSYSNTGARKRNKKKIRVTFLTRERYINKSTLTISICNNL